MGGGEAVHGHAVQSGVDCTVDVWASESAQTQASHAACLLETRTRKCAPLDMILGGGGADLRGHAMSATHIPTLFSAAGFYAI